MSHENRELQDILSALGQLKARVQVLTAEAAQDPPGEPDAGGAGPTGAPPAEHKGQDSRASDPLVLMRVGIAELNGLNKVADFPEYFAKLAGRTGLRMLLLKRWRSGLQVLLERNVTVPREAKQKRPDGRAPIPCEDDDVFGAVAQEVQVYAGPVPVRHFPLDLTLMLGRGTRDRRIVILPLPARERWSSFVYLDGDRSQERHLAVVEILALHALDRLRLLHEGEHFREGRVAGLLKAELHRRRQRQVQRAGMDASAPAEENPGSGPDRNLTPEGIVQSLDEPAASGLVYVNRQRRDDVAADPPAADETAAPVAPGPDRPSLGIPASVLRAQEARIAADAIVEAWEGAVFQTGGDDGGTAGPASGAGEYPPGEPMAPEDILHRAGELPALPKAAVHILSVVDDPRTTATRLEKAVAMDQALTAKILRIANSPFYGAVREIHTVSEAIVRLGYMTIRNWTLVTATKSVFLAPGAGTLFQKIWRQSILSAMATQLVAQVLRQAEPETVFVGGLMQNIGQLVLARSQPELFQQVLTVSAEEGLPYYIVEQELLGFDHGDLGALLIKEWNLSEELEQAVRWHHRLDHRDAQSRQLAATVCLGEEIAACTGGNPEELDLRWEKSRAAAILEVPAGVFATLREQAQTLSIEPGFFS